MRYKILGSSELNISELTFGCMSLKGTYSDSEKVIHRAIEGGINFFDTADLYQAGENEVTLGKALKEVRKEVLIASKVGNQMRSDGSGWDWNPGKEYILKAVEKSLKRLQTDYIDLYQLHGGTIEDPIDETIEAFETLKEQGKIRYYGISSIRPNVIREYVSKSNIVSVMMQHSLLDRRSEETCLDLLDESNIGVLGRGALAQGILAGKDSAQYLTYDASDIQKVKNTLKIVSSNLGLTASQVATLFSAQTNGITSVVTGSRTEAQLLDNLGAVQKGNLTAEVFEALKSTLSPNTYEKHR